MDNYNQYRFEYWNAVRALNAFEKSDRFKYMTGYIGKKAVKRTNKNGEHLYHYLYFFQWKKINSKWQKTQTRINENELEVWQHKVNTRTQKETRRIYNKLKQHVIRLFRKLKKIKNIDIEELNAVMEHRANTEPFREEDKGVISLDGVKMRSGGECLVANLASYFNLSWLYEPVVNMRKNLFHPDFAFFINGKKVFLEFLGKAEDPDYMKRWHWKAKKYWKNGFVMGKNMICIACTDSQKIDSQKLASVLFNLTKGIIPQKVIYV